MTDTSTLPAFPRQTLYAAFNGNQRMVSAFEEWINALRETVEQATAATDVSALIGSANFLLLTANDALTGGRTLAAGNGVALTDDGTHLTVSLDDIAAKVAGGFPVRFIVTGSTSLILPTLGTVATVADIAGAVAGSVTSFNTRTGAVTLTSADVTGALGYTPTSVTGLTGAQSVAAFKTGLTLVKADVGLGSVDNTADAAKNVLTATKLATGRTIGITGDATWSSGAFDGSGNVTAALTLATVNATVGTFGTFRKVPTITVDGKGRITNVVETTISLTFASITGTPTTLLGYGITDAQPLNSNLTTIAGLTATTNNFIVSVGSAWASRTPAQVKTTLAIAASDVSGLATVATSGLASDLTGTLAAAQMPALTGDVTTTAGAVATTIGAGKVTLAMQANMPTASVVYRKTAGAGAPEVQTLATLKTDLGLTGTNSGDQTITLTGDATGSGTGSFAVTVAKINGVALSGLATGILKNTTATGVPSIAIAADFPTLNQSTTGSAATLTTSRNFSIGGNGITAAAVGFNGSAAVVLSASVDAGHITLARMANLAANTFIGNNTGAGATPLALTPAQAKTLLAIANTDVSGLGTMSTQNATAVAITGGSVTADLFAAAGSFSSGVAQFYTSATLGAVLSAGTGSTYDLYIATRAGNVALSVNAATDDVQLRGGVVNVTSGGATIGGFVKVTGVAFASLPAAATAGAGARAFITDCNTAAFNAAAAGGGANKIGVISDGAAWKVG